MPELLKAVLDWGQTNLSSIAVGLVVAAVGGLAGLVFRRGQKPQVAINRSTSGGPIVAAGTARQQLVVDRAIVDGPLITGPTEHLTIINQSIYLDGLAETKDVRKRALLEEGRAYQGAGRHEEAIRSFRACLSLADNGNERSALLDLIGRSFLQQKRLREAYGTFAEAVNAAWEGDDSVALGAALTDIGIVCGLRGQQEEALRYFQIGLEISRRIGDRLHEAQNLSHLGVIYYATGDLDLALKNLQPALKVSRDVNDPLLEAAILGQLGLTYSRMGKLPQAVEHHQLSLATYRRIGYELGEAMQLGYLGDAYSQGEERERAEANYQAAFKILREMIANLEVATNERNIAQIEFQKRKGEQ